SHGMQYQHSSYFICALPVFSLIHKTSSGQTSMQVRQPLSAIHFSSSTITGTMVIWDAVGITNSKFVKSLVKRFLHAIADRPTVRVHSAPPRRVQYPAFCTTSSGYRP